MSTTTFQYFRDASGQLWSISVNPDGSLTTTEVNTGSPSPGGGTPIGTLVAGDILDACIRDAQILSNNRVALMDYLNRVIHRVLRESQWIFLKSQPQQFDTIPGVTSYYIGLGPVPNFCTDTGLLLGDVQNILVDEVFDITNKRQLMPDSPSLIYTSLLDDPPKTFQYDNTWSGVLNILPVGANAQPSTIQFRYMKTRNKVSQPTDILQIPNDYQDLLIAGVNMYFTMYMDHDPSYAKTTMWSNLFKDGIRSMRKELNLNFRATDFISPDTVTQGQPYRIDFPLFS
jgi:hypothetical protein